ncbi:SDR family NAD(P)-dependent oxidoreductase [Demequina gelatinilytica]|uniref:SDR family NAD(P)-dependent oxidoreductase n=1 Tax=Demequina gelatinilytica TaxID=1638980 RepID=UPI000784411D|nr:SDR family oxidoreductase [Demequina gelatinilytica]
MRTPPSCVVVTGASSGFGAEFARRFAAEGSDVVLVARRLDRLESLAAEIESAHDVRATPIAADLSLPGAAAALVDEVVAQDLHVDGLVANAGLGIEGPFVDADPDRIHQLLAVNVVAVTELTRLLLPRLMGSRAGVLVTVTSTAAYQAIPTMALYAASKAYVRSLTEALWHETRGTRLRVLAVAPGPSETEFFTAAGSDRFKVGQVVGIADVVEAALSELDRGAPRPSRIVGWRNAVQSHAARVAPARLSLAVAAKATGGAR